LPGFDSTRTQAQEEMNSHRHVVSKLGLSALLAQALHGTGVCQIARFMQPNACAVSLLQLCIADAEGKEVRGLCSNYLAGVQLPRVIP